MRNSIGFQLAIAALALVSCNMRLATDQMSAKVPCYQCGYDLRAHEQNGTCPECGMGVAESFRLAALPRRPAWKDSDPAWRRRMLAGVWVLVLLPLMDVLNILGWSSSVPAPHVFGFCDPANTLDGRLIAFGDFYPAMIFCIGMVLLFSEERGRRPSRLDWTRRWGVLCCYVVLLLYATQFLFDAAYEVAAIAAVFMDIALKYQPGSINLLVWLGSAWLRYGPSPSLKTFGAQIVFSALTVLLGCVPLFSALRSCGSKLFATILLAPLVAFALIQIVQGSRHFAGDVNFSSTDIFFCSVYFRPEVVLQNLTDSWFFSHFSQPPPLIASIAETLKWCIVLGIAAWLTLAQVLAWWRGRRMVGAEGRLNA